MSDTLNAVLASAPADDYLEKVQAEFLRLVDSEAIRLRMALADPTSTQLPTFTDAQASTFTKLVEDALRYRALQSGRVSHFGSAGLGKTGVDPNGSTYDGYAYYVMEAWTITPDDLSEESLRKDKHGRDAMRDYTAIAALRNLWVPPTASIEDRIRQNIDHLSTYGLTETLVGPKGPAGEDKSFKVSNGKPRSIPGVARGSTVLPILRVDISVKEGDDWKTLERPLALTESTARELFDYCWAVANSAEDKSLTSVILSRELDLAFARINANPNALFHEHHVLYQGPRPSKD